MADEVKIIRIQIDASKAVDGGRAAQNALEDIEKSTGTLSRGMTQLEATMKSLFVGYLGMQGVRALVSAADAFTQLTNALKVAGVAGHDLVGVQDRLFAAANRNGVEIGAVGQLYSRLAQSSRELGTSQDQMLKFVDGVTAALRIQGGSTASASGALLQLSQAMGAGIVRAEEFNSILEGALPIAQAAARGIDGMEGSVARLRAAVNAGTVTSKVFFDGALKGFQETERVAAGASLTIAGGITALTNSWTRFIGELDKTTGGTSTAGEVFGHLAKVLESTRREVELIKQAWDDASTTAGDWAADVAQAFYDINVEGATARGRLIDTFEGIGTDLERIFVDAMNAVLAAVEKGLNALSTVRLPSILGGGTRTLYDPISLGRIGGGAPGGLALEPSGGMTNAQIMRQNTIDFFGGPKDYPGAREAQRLQYATQLLVSGTAPTDTGGGGGAILGGKGGSTKKELDEIAKLIEKIEKDAQRLRESFEESTVALSEANDILAAEIKLIDAAPDIRARELAILKATNEAKKAGVDLESQAFKDRLAAVETGEKLRIQQDEIKRSQELWTEPLKQALRDIQSIGADAFDKLLENGTFSFEELGQTFMRIVRRMAAEFLALATIRPVMSVLVNAVSPSMAQSMGLGSSPLGGGSLFGGSGGGGISMPSWLGGGSVSGFLSSPISFGGSVYTSASSPASMIAPTGATGASLGGITWGQGLGALAGAGMGIYQLASGNGSASSTIGGISSIVGAGLSLIPGIGPFLGAGVSLLGNMLPGLFGMDKPPTITNQTYGQLTYGDGGWYTTGGAWGPSANSGDTERGLKSLGGGISSVFDLLGGVKDPRKVWGLSAQNKTVSGQGWSSSSDSLYLVDPNGGQQLWRMNESNMMDTGSAQVAYRSILEGAVGAITENMRKAILQTGQTMGGTPLQAIAETIVEVKAFDDTLANLGKTVITAEAAVKAIDDSFASMYATADKYGLSTADLDASKAAARLGVATDFGKSLSREILSMTDPKAAALADLDDWKAGAIENNKWLLDNVTGTLDQINKIEELYGLRRAAIVEQTTANALGGLKSTIDRLLYGDLSGASPGDVLSGTKGTYMADLAQAFTGDAAAAGRLNSSSADYMQAAAGYYGTSSAAYQALRRQTIIDVSSAYRYNGGQFSNIPGGYDVIMGGGGFTGLPGMGAANLNIGLSTVSQQFVGLSEQFSQVLDSNATRDQKIDELLDLLRRYVVGLAA